MLMRLFCLERGHTVQFQWNGKSASLYQDCPKCHSQHIVQATGPKSLGFPYNMGGFHGTKATGKSGAKQATGG